MAQETKRCVQQQNNETDRVATAISEITATVQKVSNHVTQAELAASEANNQTQAVKKLSPVLIIWKRQREKVTMFQN